MAGALIAVILVVLLVLKLKNRSNNAYKVDERKNFAGNKAAPPSHSNSNAALLNTTGGPVSGGGVGVMGRNTAAAPLSSINPALTGLDKKSPPSKKSGKDIKEWYV